MKVRVRYAASPTGPYQHVGGARTALFNYIFALHSDGEFFIRIEDTDQKRYDNNAVTDLISTLVWLGFDWVDGPNANELIKLGVDEIIAHRYGKNSNQSYVQSNRSDIYFGYAHDLIESGHAYPVFADESIEDNPDIKVQEARFQQNVYRWRSASPFMIRKTMATKTPYHIRLRMPREDDYEVCYDYLRGTIKFHQRKLYDPVILKTPRPEEGIPAIPSYHLAHVVDDHLMNTTHVLRGEEWLSSLPYHNYLWKCFGWDIPIYCHLPVILNPTGRGKMSKRETKSGTGEVVPVFVKQYKERGFLSQALKNFMSLVGWSPGDNKEIMDFDDIIDLFNLNRISKTGAMWDIRKLKNMNNHYIRMLGNDEFANLAEDYV